MGFHKSKTCGRRAFIQMFLFDGSRKQRFRGISYRESCSRGLAGMDVVLTGEQQRSDASAAVGEERAESRRACQNK